MNEGHDAVDNYMVPLGPGQSSHHLPVDHIIKVSGDKAHFNAQFVVFQVQNAERPESGWPAGALGAQGTVTPIEAGYYDTHLRRYARHWNAYLRLGQYQFWIRPVAGMVGWSDQRLESGVDALEARIAPMSMQQRPGP